MATTILTHPGQAHRDEFLACCVLLATRNPYKIERREPTVDDLENKDTYVVDVGEFHDPEFHNFDHHQFPADAEPTCALTLVLKHLGLYEAAKAASTWLEVTEILDSKGPMRAAALYGIATDTIEAFRSPIENQMLVAFGARSIIFPSDPDGRVMRKIGDQLVQYWKDFGRRLQYHRDFTVVIPSRGEPTLVVAVDLPASENPQLALEAYCREIEAETKASEVAVTVTRDDRGPGWCLYRRNDHPAYDFTRLANHPDVTFAHKNGFVAKTVEMSMAAATVLVEMARTQKSA